MVKTDLADSINKNQMKKYIREKTDLMSDNEIEKYIIERTLFPKEEDRIEQLSKLEKFIIHNSFTSDEVKKTLKDAGLDFEEYFPNKSKESHFYVPETKSIHIFNNKDPERFERDKNLILGLEDIFRKGLKLKVINYHDRPEEAVDRFKKFAFKLVDEVFNNIKGDINKEDYINIIMGPFESFEFDDTEILHENDNDYLDYKIIKINKKLTISLDYVFAGQSYDVLNKIFSNLNANHNLAGIKARIFHYGKVGVLNKVNDNGIIKVGDICIPNAFITEEDSEKDKSFCKYNLKNELSSDKRLIERFKKETRKILYFGSTFNSMPILKQKRSNLNQILEKQNARFLDMEWTKIGFIGMEKRTMYPYLGPFKYYFAGTASDIPLEGINLGNTNYKRESEIPISEFYKKIISNS